MLRDPSALQAAARIVQFPFAAPVAEEKTEEELARIAERRKEQGKKLQEIAAKNRTEKVLWFTSLFVAYKSPSPDAQVQLLQKESDLHYLLNLKENRSNNKREWQVSMMLSYAVSSGYLPCPPNRTRSKKRVLMMKWHLMKQSKSLSSTSKNRVKRSLKDRTSQWYASPHCKATSVSVAITLYRKSQSSHCSMFLTLM